MSLCKKSNVMNWVYNNYYGVKRGKFGALHQKWATEEPQINIYLIVPSYHKKIWQIF